MADYGINFSKTAFEANPVDELPESYKHDKGPVPPPSQESDSDEYLCGSTGNAHSYANAGRDQDRSRLDERVPAQGCARYVS